MVHLPEEEVEEAKQTKSVKDTSSIIGGFLGFLPKHEQDNPIYLVTISQEDDETGDDMICCQPRILFFKKRKRNNAPFENLVGTYKRNSFAIRHRLATEVDPTPYDTSTKFYERKLLGGWPVYLEPNWHMGDLEIEKRLGQDLKCAAEILPKHAVDCKQSGETEWIPARRSDIHTLYSLTMNCHFTYYRFKSQVPYLGKLIHQIWPKGMPYSRKRLLLPPR